MLYKKHKFINCSFFVCLKSIKWQWFFYK